MVGNGDVHSIYIGNIAFWGMSTSQFWQHTVGSMYPAQFDSLTFYGFRNVFGNATTKCLMTQTCFTGHWQVIGPQDVQFNIGGSDNAFWMGGYLNIGSNPSVAGNGRFLIQFDWLGKTDIGKIYVTAANGWLGVKVTGACPKLNFYGGEFEGQNINDPCYG